MQPKRPRINPLILALALAAVLMVWSVMGSGSGSTSGSTMSYSTVVHYFEHNQVTAFTLDRNTSVITLNLKEGDLPLPDVSSTQSTTQATGGLLSGMFSTSSESTGAVQEDDGTVTVRYKLPYAYVFIENVEKYIESYDAANPDAPMTYDYTSLKETIPWMEIIFYLGMLGCTGFLLFSMMRGGVGGGGGIMNVGKAKVKDEHENKKTATFADVAGEDEEKEELKEVVEFLKSPDKFNSLGARIPHGVLLVGPPGTGKTLLARACAGEAGVPFYSISGSDFVEMYVGVGASRVRDLFDKAKKTMPCIIFIDEIDAIGKTRDTRFGGNDEREQTLNQLLAEMDGFDPGKGIIVLAATNRPEVLDQALLRPGRFDRRITIDRPNLAGRIATLEVHTRNIKLGEDVDLKKVALATAGCVGADLANIVNEAALRAVRKGRKLVTQEDMLAAFEFVIAGSEKKNSVLTEFEKKLVAYHEVGHAMVAYRQKNAEPVQKITIVPHTEGSLGYTLLMPEEDKTNLRTRDELMAKIAVSMGGRAAEEVIMHTMTNGASQDIQEATNIARNMVAMYGMSDEFGMMALGSVRSQYLDGGYGLDCAQETAAVMDKAVKEILEKCYADAVKVIEENIDDMHKVVAYLLEKETITGGEMVAILEGRDPATVEDAYASTRRSDSDFRPSVPSTIEAPARHISMTSEKIEMPPLDGEAPDESAASDAENGKNAETPAEETPAQDAPAGDGAETPDHE